MDNNCQNNENPMDHENQAPPSDIPPYAPPYIQSSPAVTAVSYEEKRWLKKKYFGTFSKVIIHCIGGYILAQILFIAMMLNGYEFRYTEDGTAIIDWIYSAAGSLPSILCCIGLFMYDKSKAHKPISSYFKASGISWKFTIGFFGTLIFAYSISAYLQNVLIVGMFSAGVSPISENYLTETDLTPAYLVSELIFTVILAPVAEELMYRGVVLRRLSGISQTFAIFVSALLFGLMHGNLLQAVLGFFMGVVLGYAAVKTGSLILPIAGHMFINLTASSTSFVEYFLGEEISNNYWSAVLLIFFIAGFAVFAAAAAMGGVHFPQYTDYHRQRTWKVMLTCVSFWIMIIYMAYDIISKFGPVTDKLMS